MRLAHGRHLAFHPRLPRLGTWAETFAALCAQVPGVRDQIGRPGEECGLGLRLGEQAAHEILKPRQLAEFSRWLTAERCYVFTLDGPSEGANGEVPDWTHPDSLAHARRLLNLFGELLPENVSGSVSVSPGFIQEATPLQPTEPELQTIYANLIHAAIQAAEVSGRTGRLLCLAVEALPHGLCENAAGTIRFLEPLIEAFPDQFGVCVDGNIAPGVLAAFDRAEIPVVKMRLNTSGDQPDDVLDWLAADPSRCPHLEIMHRPPHMPQSSEAARTVETSAREYEQTLRRLIERGLA